MTFTTTRNNIASELLESLKGNTTGLTFKSVKLTGNPEASGLFQEDPFGLKSGIVLSTGKIEELAGQNSLDGGFVPPNSSSSSTAITFEKLSGLTGISSNPQTAIYRADLSKVRFDINSITIADGGTVTGGASGSFSGFDLDGILLSNTKIESATEINALTGLDVFDFSPARTVLTPGTQRPPTDPAQPDLFGTVNGNINNAIATLGNFDANATVKGFTSLGDNGKIELNLKNSVSTTNGPLYLYIGEAGDNGEVAAGQIVVSENTINDDLSTDFGLSGPSGDETIMQIEFDADDTADQIYLQFVFGSEEFAEFGGGIGDRPRLDDVVSIELNDEEFNLARLNDGASLTIDNLVLSPLGPYHPDFIYNPVNTGSASSQTKLDGYTKILTFTGELEKNRSNTLTIKVKDTADGLLDSAVFLKADSLGTSPPPTIPPPTGSQIIPVPPGSSGTAPPFVVDNFGGVGRGNNPSPATIAEVDTLKFTDTGLIARNLILTQNSSDLEITFEGVAHTPVTLKNFALENLDNLGKVTKAKIDLGNILFDGQTVIRDNYDVFNAEWQFNQVLNRNTVTFLNDLNNTVKGFDKSNDVINGQSGNDRLSGLSGNDLLRGGADSDTLLGGDGDDTLVGGVGDDQVTGGKGRDRFILSPDAGTDTIIDFQDKGDRMGLSGIVFTDLTITQGTGANRNNTLINVNNGSSTELLAVLTGIRSNTITFADFINV